MAPPRLGGLTLRLISHQLRPRAIPRPCKAILGSAEICFQLMNGDLSALGDLP